GTEGVHQLRDLQPRAIGKARPWLLHVWGVRADRPHPGPRRQGIGGGPEGEGRQPNPGRVPARGGQTPQWQGRATGLARRGLLQEEGRCALLRAREERPPLCREEEIAPASIRPARRCPWWKESPRGDPLRTRGNVLRQGRNPWQAGARPPGR